jgi:hypothetical protein
VIDVLCKGLVLEVVGGAMKRELLERKETEVRGVVVELYTRCSPLKEATARSCPTSLTALSSLGQHELPWLHLPFFGYMMTRRSLDLVGETSSLDPNYPKPMTKRG